MPQGSACLAEIVEQDDAAAARRLAQRNQRIHLGVLDGLLLGRGLGALDPLAELADLAEAVERVGGGGQAVAPGAADLLIVALDVLRQVHVEDEPHVRLVDAHAERDGGDHDHPVLAQKDVLVVVAFAAFEARVVGDRLHPARGEEGGGLVHLAAGLAVDDAALAFVRLEEGEEFGAAVLPRGHRQRDVGPVERADEHLRRRREQPFADVVAGDLVGGRGEGDGLADGEIAPDFAEEPVFGPEVVAPLGDAVRLVDGHHRDRRIAQRIQRLHRGEAFGRDVEELEVAVRGARRGAGSSPTRRWRS